MNLVESPQRAPESLMFTIEGVGRLRFCCAGKLAIVIAGRAGRDEVLTYHRPLRHVPLLDASCWAEILTDAYQETVWINYRAWQGEPTWRSTALCCEKLLNCVVEWCWRIGAPSSSPLKRLRFGLHIITVTATGCEGVDTALDAHFRQTIPVRLVVLVLAAIRGHVSSLTPNALLTHKQMTVSIRKPSLSRARRSRRQR